MLILPLILAFASLPAGEEARRDALTRYGVARIQTRNSQLASAVIQLEKAAKVDPTAVAPKRDLARLYADLGRDAQAIRMAREVLERDPADVDTARVLARVYSEGKRYQDAAKTLASVLDSPKLEKRPATKMAIIRDFAKACENANDWPAAANAWQRLGDFIDANFTSLKGESYDPKELHHERAIAWEKLGTALIECKKPAEAVKAFFQAAALFNDTAKAHDAHAAARLNWNLTLAHQANGDYANAIESLNAFLTLKPTKVSYYVKLAELMRWNQQSQHIEGRLNALMNLNPECPAISWVNTAEIAKRNFALAHQFFQKQSLTTTDGAFFQLLVQTYREQNKPRELLAIGDALFPVKPEGVRKAAHTVTPEQSDRQQAFANALNANLAFAPALLKASANGRERSAELWELLGWLAERSDAPQDHERSLKAALLATGERSTTALAELADHYRKTRQWQKFVDLIDQHRDLNAIWRVANKSTALVELGRSDEAFALMTASAGLARNDAQRHIAHLHGMLGKYDDMLNVVNALLLETDDLAGIRRIRYLRAEAYLGLKRIDDMEMELRGLLEDDPDEVQALNNLGYNLADRNRKLPEAERLIRRALEIDRHNRAKAGEAFPVSGIYLDSLGWVLFRQGQLTEARKQLKQATELPDGRTDAVVWDHLGDVCFRLNDKPAAKAAWTNAASRYVHDHRGKLLGRADEVTRKLKLCE